MSPKSEPIKKPIKMESFEQVCEVLSGGHETFRLDYTLPNGKVVWEIVPMDQGDPASYAFLEIWVANPRIDIYQVFEE